MRRQMPISAKKTPGRKKAIVVLCDIHIFQISIQSISKILYSLMFENLLNNLKKKKNNSER